MRRFYYLKPSIQYAFTSFFALLVAIEIILFGLLLYAVEHFVVYYSYDLMLYIRFSILLGVLLIFTGFNFWYGVRLSHRIAGPMVQIKRVLERAAKGEYKSRIQLRSNDYLHEIGDELNRLLEELESQKKKPLKIGE
jgi:two-component system sensor histidine kinase ResE